MDLYETIFKRRSVRNYDKIPLDASLIIQIKKYVEETHQLKGCCAKFEVVNSDMVSDNKAPHYILAFCNNTPENQINVGYVLEKADLYMQSIGLGSLWFGMGKMNENEGGDFCIMMAFGKTNMPCRNGEQDFKRLPLNKICETGNSIIKAARLSPSACNSQPWFIHYKEGEIEIEYTGRGLLGPFLKKKMSRIDIGIITRIIETALMQEGKQIKSVLPVVNGKSFGSRIVF